MVFTLIPRLTYSFNSLDVSNWLKPSDSIITIAPRLVWPSLLITFIASVRAPLILVPPSVVCRLRITADTFSRFSGLLSEISG
ncbi:hypothetical protein D3C86_1726330 [compost metagenome]